MITLYHAPMSRYGSILWLLEELGVPYQTKIVDIRRADGSSARAMENPHPHGKVPVLTDGEDTVFEGSAIALYLADKYRTKTMGPLTGQPQRGEYLSWLAYRPGVMEPPFSRAASKSNMCTALWAGLRRRRCSTTTWLHAIIFSATPFPLRTSCWAAASIS